MLTETEATLAPTQPISPIGSGSIPLEDATVVPQKRRPGSMSAVRESSANTSEAILQLFGRALERPETNQNKTSAYIVLDHATDKTKTRFMSWHFCQRYQPADGAGTHKDVMVLSFLCHRLGSLPPLLLAGSNITNTTKHLRKIAAGDAHTKMQLTHSRAALHMTMNPTGSSRPDRGS